MHVEARFQGERITPSLPFGSPASSALYDFLYPDKDYKGEAEWVADIINKNNRSGDRSVLDVACGTGLHLAHWHKEFPGSAGVDISESQIQRARQRLPKEVQLFIGDMADFSLPRRFGAVVCEFAGVGHLKTKPLLIAGMENMARHGKPGSLVAIDPFLFPDQYAERIEDQIRLWPVEPDPDQSIVRMNFVSKLPPEGEGTITIDMLFLHGQKTGNNATADVLFEHHELGVYTEETYLDTLRQAGLEEVRVEQPPAGLKANPLLVGRVALAA